MLDETDTSLKLTMLSRVATVLGKKFRIELEGRTLLLIESLLTLKKIFSGRKDFSCTMVYTLVLNKGGHGVKSPVDMFVAGLD